jgi:PAS domain-containing protein
VTADDVERWCTSAGSAVLDRDGRQVGVQIRLADVTGRRRIEERVRESEERARSIVATAGDAFVATDADGTVMEWNGAAPGASSSPR